MSDVGIVQNDRSVANSSRPSDERGLDALAVLLRRFIRGRGGITLVPNMWLTYEHERLDNVDLPYELMMCIVVSGTKSIRVGTQHTVVTRGDLFFSLVDAPVTASFEPPYLSVALLVDELALANVLADIPQRQQWSDAPMQGYLAAPVDEPLLAAVTRWVGLLDEPEHIAALAPRLEEEILYRVLVGPLGDTIRAGLTSGATSRIRDVATYLTEHVVEQVTIAELSERAVMSPATLHRHFKRLIGLSPHQFQRTTRLHQARQLLASGSHSAASAASAVGYLSASQFSRDYRQQYGITPGRDAVAMR